MRLATWNVNSIRARLERLVDWLASRRPDVVCLQETKCADDQFPFAELAAVGYRAATFGQRTYNGVAILAREEPADVVRGLQDGIEDPQSRAIAASFGALRVVCAYAPNGQALGSSAYAYKLAWFQRLRRTLEARHAPGELLAVCGDFNVAPEPRDVYDPVGWEGQVLCSAPEREALAHLCGFGLRDAFRLHHPEAGRYSWWDYRMLSFAHNRGLRIDHLLVTDSLAERCRGCDIDRDARKGKKPSDHAPLWAELDLGGSLPPLA
jgi:exodeoxyribonuclease-3